MTNNVRITIQGFFTIVGSCVVFNWIAFWICARRCDGEMRSSDLIKFQPIYNINIDAIPAYVFGYLYQLFLACYFVCIGVSVIKLSVRIMCLYSTLSKKPVAKGQTEALVGKKSVVRYRVRANILSS